MREVLEFIFSGFWVFMGILVLMTSVFSGVAQIVGAWRQKGAK